jgi:hypothetical protein
MIMGYIPTRKYLKDDAIPTIVADLILIVLTQ